MSKTREQPTGAGLIQVTANNALLAADRVQELHRRVGEALY